MVGAADADEVLQVGRASLGPMGEVVGLVPRHRPVAAGPHAASVASLESAARRGPGHPTSPAHVEDGGRAVEDHPSDRGVAAEPANRLGSDRAAPLQLARGRAVPTDERVKGGGDLEMGSLAAAVGEQSGVHGVTGELDQRVGEPAVALPEVARVPDAVAVLRGGERLALAPASTEWKARDVVVTTAPFSSSCTILLPPVSATHTLG